MAYEKAETCRWDKLCKNSWFQTFAVFWMLYALFWVILRRLNFIFRRFGTLFFQLHRQVGEDGTECSETSAYKIQTPGNYPEERIQYARTPSFLLLLLLLLLQALNSVWCLKVMAFSTTFFHFPRTWTQVVQFLTFIWKMSCLTLSLLRYLGLPRDLLVRGFHLNIFLTVLVSGILCTWPNQRSLRTLI